MRPEWIMQMRTAAKEFGTPVFGLEGPYASEGVLNGHGGQPCTQLTLLYRIPAGRVEVTTGAKPLGDTVNLVMNVIGRSIPEEVHLSRGISVDERSVLVPVDGTPTQVRVVEASTGDWMAVGGLKKRHLLLTGTSGTHVEDLVLGPVALKFEP